MHVQKVQVPLPILASSELSGVGVPESFGVKVTVEVNGRVGMMMAVRVSGFSSATPLGVTCASVD